MTEINLLKNNVNVAIVKMCNDEAARKGYKDWNDWHDSEIKEGIDKLETASHKYRELAERIVS